LYGFIIASEKSELLNAISDSLIIYSKIGTFDTNKFYEYCKGVGNVNLTTLIVDLDAVEDDGAFVKGIRQYKFVRPHTRIILIAAGRTPGDPAVSKLVGLGIYDIINPKIQEDYEEEEQEENSIGVENEEYEDLEIDYVSLLETQLSNKASYAEASRWHVDIDFEITNPAPVKENKLIRKDVKQNTFPEFDEEEFLDEIPVKEKVIIKDRIVGSIFISVIGLERNTGATHLSLLIGNFLKKKGLKVAVIEANNSEDLSTIESAYEGGPYQTKEKMFNIRGVDYYKNIQTLNIPEIINKYNFIILDIGSEDNTEHFEEFFRSHVQIVTASGAIWKREKIELFQSAYQDLKYENIILAIPFADKYILDDLSKETDFLEIVSIPVHSDPFENNKETSELLNELLKNFLPGIKDGQTVSTKILYAILTVTVAILITIAFLFFK